MNTEETDFYKILGIDKSASEDEVKKSFRRFSKKYHPDMQHGKSDAEKKEAEEMFKKGQAAYECLSDPEKRKIYDQFGIDGLKGHAQQGGFSGGMSDGLAEFLRQHMRGFGFHFGFDEDDNSEEQSFGFNPFGNNRQSKRKAPSNSEPEDGRSYRIRMEVDLEDVIFGTEKEFSINGLSECPECHGKKCDGYDECPHCHGRGMSQQIRGNTIIQSTCEYCGGSGFSPKNVCKKCDGSGRIEVKREIKIKIPKGLPEGGQLRVRGAAECGLNGGANGDLYIVIQTKNNPIFKRTNDLDLEMDLFVNPLVSVCGGNVSIPTPYELKTTYLSAGMKNGQKLRLGGFGIKKDNGESGDLIANVIYDSINPAELSEKEKEILKNASDVVFNNSKCLTNAMKQSKELNKLKLPWIMSL